MLMMKKCEICGALFDDLTGSNICPDCEIEEELANEDVLAWGEI